MNSNDFDFDEEDIRVDENDDDEDYLQMLRGLQKPKGNKFDFENSKKYRGEVRKQKEMSEEKENDQEDLEEEDLTIDEDEQIVEQPMQKKKLQNKKTIKIKSVEQRISKPKKISIEQELRQIQKEDQNIINQTQQDSKELYETSLALREQLVLWNNLVNYRQNLQKIFENAKRLPGPSDEFIKLVNNPSSYKDLQEMLQQNIQILIQNRNQLYPFSDSQLDSDITTLQYENIQEICFNLCDQKKQIIEEDIIKCSQKTSLINNIQKKQGISGSLNFGSLIQTPIGQTQKAMQNKDKLIQKSRLKRSLFRILGQGPEDLNKNTSAFIYDDTDFYLELLKEQVLVEKEGDNDMLVRSTQQYLLMRQTQNQEKENKQVDRKASKSRKIKYEQHQKIINFMVPLDNFNEIEARDDILNSIFGGKKSQNEEQEQIVKKRKFNRNVDEEIIRLI